MIPSVFKLTKPNPTLRFCMMGKSHLKHAILTISLWQSILMVCLIIKYQQ